MKFEISKKTLIIIVSSIVGIILLWGILSIVGHGRYDRNDVGRNFGAPGCGMSQWNPATMMSGMQDIITTKDYAAFQTLFSGSKMVQQISTPEKFAIRVELQATIKKIQDLETQLWSGDNDRFGPMMGYGCQPWAKAWRNLGRQMERWDTRGNMTPARRGQVRRR